MRRRYDGRIKPVKLITRLTEPTVKARLAATTKDLIASVPRVSLDATTALVLRGLRVPPPLAAAIDTAATEIVADERSGLAVLPDDGTMSGGIAARRRARALARFNTTGTAELAAWAGELRDLLGDVISKVELPKGGTPIVRVKGPVIGFVERPGALIKQIVAAALNWSTDGVRPGGQLARQVQQRLLQKSGMTAEEARQRPRGLVWPSDEKASADELIDDYLGDTAFADLLRAEIEWGIDDRDLAETMWLTARIGHGKSQTIEWLFCALQSRPEAERPAMLIVDSQGEMLPRIARRQWFAPGGRLADQLIYIDPREEKRPIAMNPLMMGRARLATYPSWMREQLENGTIEGLEYLLTALLSTELSQKMRVSFRFMARLLMSIEGGASIATVMDVLDDPERFAKDIARLDPTARRFFETQLFDKSNASTVKAIVARLFGLLEQRSFERLMSAHENRLDLFEAFQAGRIVLCDTAKDFLKEERSAIVGRFLLAAAFGAVFERAAIPRDKRRPVYIVLDEAQEYLADALVAKFLVQCRKYSAGVLISHQYASQLPTDLRRALAGMAAVKMVGAVSDHDARDLASDMATSPAFLLSMRRGEGVTGYALHVRNKTRTAVPLSVPFGELDRIPEMSAADWERVLERNRQRYGAPVISATPAPIDDSDDDSDDWRS